MPPNIYTSYMLRLHWAQNADHPTWVASIQSTKTGELRWFPNVDALILFLRDEFCTSNEDGKIHTTDIP
jgi:hypothetical protein